MIYLSKVHAQNVHVPRCQITIMYHIFFWIFWNTNELPVRDFVRIILMITLILIIIMNPFFNDNDIPVGFLGMKLIYLPKGASAKCERSSSSILTKTHDMGWLRLVGSLKL